MASYFEYFQNVINKTDEIKGTCYSMCSEEEFKLRDTEKMVHVLEVLGDERKLVKSYCRSAADFQMAVPHLLRPYSVLVDTVQYLLMDVTKRVNVSQSVVYDFVNDRLRAIRQDMTIQRLPPDQCVQLLEPMVRFYVYYGYLLSNLPLKDYDPILNKKYLLECTKWCLNCYDSIIEKPDKDVVERLASFLDKMELNSNMCCDRVLVECVYMLGNLDDVHPSYRFHKLPKNIKSDSRLQLARSILIWHHQGNFVRVGRLMDKLCALTYCAAFTSLPNLQRRSLQVLSTAYNNKRLTVPSVIISRWLKFTDSKETEAVCSHYGLKVENGGVLFDKTAFNVGARLHQLRTPDIKIKFNIKNILDIYKYI